MPFDIERRARRVGIVIAFLAQGVVAIAVVLAVNRMGWSLTTLGLRPNHWLATTIKGAIAGFAWLALYVCILLLERPQPSQVEARILERPLWFWLSSGLSSAIVEEAWRISCLLALADHGRLEAVGGMAIACGIAHGLPLGRLVSTTLFAAYAAVLFFWTGSLWAVMAAHAIVNIGTIGLLYLTYRW